MTKYLLYCVMAGFCFGVWPLVARASKLNYQWITVMLFVVAGAFMLLYAVTSMPQLPAPKPLIICLVASIIHLSGMFIYIMIIGKPNVEISRYIPIILILTPIILSIGGKIFYQEQLTVTKTTGLATGLLAIWLLSIN